MSGQALNATTDFIDWVNAGKFLDEHTNTVYSQLIKNLQKASVVLLPEKGFVFDNDRPVLADEFELTGTPFPYTAFEFIGTGGSRVIILTIDTRKEFLGAGCLTVLNIMELSNQDWSVNGVVGIYKPGERFTFTEETIKKDATHSELDKLLLSQSDFKGITTRVYLKLKAGDSIPKLAFHRLYEPAVKPPFTAENVLELDVSEIRSSFLIMAQACCALACTNVNLKDIPLSSNTRNLNPRRVKQGKTPRISYRIIEYGDHRTPSYERSPTQKSSGGQQAWHIVRGHTRELRDRRYYPNDEAFQIGGRRIWIQSYAAGSAVHGASMSTLRLTKQDKDNE